MSFAVKNNLKPAENNFAPVPAGWYTVKIDGAEMKDTKDGTGNYLNLKLTILGPTHQGRVIFQMITRKNRSEKAEQIGDGQLRDIMEAIGVEVVERADDFIGAMYQVKLVIEESAGYDPKNKVTSCKPAEIVKPNIPAEQAPWKAGF